MSHEVHFAKLNTPEDASSIGSETLAPSPYEAQFSPEDLLVYCNLSKPILIFISSLRRKIMRSLCFIWSQLKIITFTDIKWSTTTYPLLSCLTLIYYSITYQKISQELSKSSVLKFDNLVGQHAIFNAFWSVYLVGRFQGHLVGSNWPQPI